MVDILPNGSPSVKSDDASIKNDSGSSPDGVDHNAMVARNIRRYREERHLSLGELARRAALSKQTLSKIELGTGNPTVGTIGAIADALGLAVRTLLTEWGSPVRISRADGANWNERGGAAERMLDTIYGSGDVRTWLLRPPPRVVHHEAYAAGTLHHCYVIDGRVRLGPDGEVFELGPGDFVRFPGDTRHLFQRLTPDALIHIMTTVPGVPQFRPVRDGSR